MRQSWSDANNSASNWNSSVTNTAPHHSGTGSAYTLQREAAWMGGHNIRSSPTESPSRFARPAAVQASRDSKVYVYDAARVGNANLQYGREESLKFDAARTPSTPSRRDWGTGSIRSAKKMGGSISEVYGSLLQEIYSSDSHQNEQESLAEQLAQELGLYDASKGLESEQERSIREREAYIK